MSQISLAYTDENGVTQNLSFSENLLKEPYKKSSLFVIKVEGQSMQPKINDQALVVADLSQKECEEGAIYLVMKDDRMWIKACSIQDQKLRFISLNPKFAHLIFEEGESRVIAKALLTFTNL